MGFILITLMLSMFFDLILGMDLKDVFFKVKDWNHSIKIKKENKKKKKTDKKMTIRIFEGKYNEIKHILIDINEEYEIALKLIEDIFPSPQLTNDKYINDVEKVYKNSKDIFDKLTSFMSTYPVEDSRSTAIIDKGINDLRESYRAMQGLTSELSILSTEGIDIDIESFEQSVDNIHNYSTLEGDDFGFR